MVNGRAVLVEGKGKGAKSHKDWRRAVKEAAELAVIQHGGFEIIDGPAKSEIIFYLPRPKSKPKARYPDVKPDLDKLERSIFDSITGSIVTNDSRIVRNETEKVYAVGEPGVVVRISEY